MANQFANPVVDEGLDDLTLDDIEKEINNGFTARSGTVSLNTPGGMRSPTPLMGGSPKVPSELKGEDLKKAVAAKYGLKLKEKPSRNSRVKSSARDSTVARSSASARSPRIEEEDEDLQNQELKRGFRYFLYHQHTLLSVMCVAHGGGLPRYARGFLFLFDLQTNLMFALTLRTTSLEFAERLFLTIFLCLVISFMMSIIFKNCGLNQTLTGTSFMGKFFTITVMMVMPSMVCIAVIVVYAMQQPDSGQSAIIIFVCSTIVSLLVEIIIWYLIYDCCKAYCSCFLCCCPNLLDDAEVAKDDIAHAKRKAKDKEQFGV